jgi:hypothetical protein
LIRKKYKEVGSKVFTGGLKFLLVGREGYQGTMFDEWSRIFLFVVSVAEVSCSGLQSGKGKMGVWHSDRGRWQRL